MTKKQSEKKIDDQLPPVPGDDKPKPFDPCAELERAEKEREAFIRQAEQRVAYFDGVIATLKQMCTRTIAQDGPPPQPED